MANHKRDQLFRALQFAADRYPHLRIGQLIDNAMLDSGKNVNDHLFNITDAELVDVIAHYSLQKGLR